MPVERADMVKGYEFAKDQYVTFSPEEMKELEEKGTRTVEITQFVPEEKIDPMLLRQGLLPCARQGRPEALRAAVPGDEENRLAARSRAGRRAASSISSSFARWTGGW